MDCSSSRRSANTSALADDGSSHWTSSTARTSGLRCEDLEPASDRDAERARIGGVASLEEKRYFERAAPRRGQHREDLFEDALEEVAEPGVRESSLRLGRPRDVYSEAKFTGGVDARKPERRLPDPRLAFEHHRRRSVGAPGEERSEGRELLVSADDLA
jgi:hypothetical protein